MPTKATKTKTKKTGGRSKSGKAAGGDQVRRAELLQIAADLFAERGYVATTVRDIADEAGILSGSLYHHFDSKESMIDAILSSFVAETVSGYQAVVAEGLGPKQTFEGLVRTSLELMVDRRSAILIYQNETGFLISEPRFSYLLDAHHKLEKIWTDVLKAGVKNGEFRKEIDVKLVYRLVRDTVWTAPRWYRPGGTLKPQRIVDQYLAVLVEGVSKH